MEETICKSCFLPKEACSECPFKEGRRRREGLIIRIEKWKRRAKNNKGVTVIEGISTKDEKWKKRALRALKSRFHCGGTLKKNAIVLQKVISDLEERMEILRLLEDSTEQEAFQPC